ncbi:MAG: hypothetical protein AB1420_12695 [Bacillota bacterium]
MENSNVFKCRVGLKLVTIIALLAAMLLTLFTSFSYISRRGTGMASG